MWVDVALRTIKAHPDGWNAQHIWKREAEALKATHDLHHSHLLDGIAAIRLGDRFYLLTEWASGGDLREYWKRNPSPELSYDLLMTALTQLLSLSEALKTLHHTGARRTKSRDPPLALDSNDEQGGIFQ